MLTSSESSANKDSNFSSIVVGWFKPLDLISKLGINWRV